MKRMLLVLSFLFISFLASAEISLASGQPCTAGNPAGGLCNALSGFGGGGVTTIPGFIAASLVILGSIIGTVAIVMVIFSGVQMVFSQGDPGAVGKAKTSMLYAIIGLAVVMFAYVIVSSILYFIGVDNSVTPGSRPDGFFINPLSDAYLFSPANDPGKPNFFDTMVRNVLGLMGAVAIFFIIWNGFRYVTSFGNDDQVKKAKQSITWAVFGLISIILSYIILRVVINTLSNGIA